MRWKSDEPALALRTPSSKRSPARPIWCLRSGGRDFLKSVADQLTGQQDIS